MEKNEITTCPYCAELIAVGASKCKHCDEWLQPELMNKNYSGRPQVQKMECKRCSNIIPILWDNSDNRSIINAECPRCGKNPYSTPKITPGELVLATIIGLASGYFLVKLFF